MPHVLVRDLSWLIALAEHEHVTDAAAVLGVSQPTLSRALARVEEELGARLFERDATGVHPNSYGELAVAAARDITRRHRQLVDELATILDPDTGVVRLAFLDSMATSLVPRLLHSFHLEAPRVRVQLRQEPAHEILRDLAAGRAELAVVSPRPGPDHGWIPLQRERLVLVVPAAHRLAGRRRVRLEELAAEEFIVVPAGFGFRSLVDQLFAAAGITPSVSFESGDLATIAGLVGAGLGVGIVPEQFAGSSNTVGVSLVARGAERTVGLTWRRDRELAPAAARFVEFVRAGSLG